MSERQRSWNNFGGMRRNSRVPEGYALVDNGELIATSSNVPPIPPRRSLTGPRASATIVSSIDDDEEEISTRVISSNRNVSSGIRNEVVSSRPPPVIHLPINDPMSRQDIVIDLAPRVAPVPAPTRTVAARPPLRVDVTVITPDIVVASRNNNNSYNTFNTLRENYLQQTGITNHYSQEVSQLETQGSITQSYGWIFSQPFYTGVHSVANQLGQNNSFTTEYQNFIRNGKFASGLSEFMQFLEVYIQRALWTSSLIGGTNQIALFRKNQQLVSHNRQNVSNTLREIFYQVYNGQVNSNRWSGDFKKIIDSVLDEIRTSFREEMDRSDIASFIPELVIASNYSQSHRWVYKLTQRDHYLNLLFAILMIRLPTVNVRREGVLSNMNYVFNFAFNEGDTTDIEAISISMEITNTNLQSIFYFIPEQNRLVGTWRQNVTVKDSVDGDRRQLQINYQTEMMRNILIKVRVPRDVADRNGQIVFDRLMDDRENNFYRTIRRTRNPFQLSSHEDSMTRLYVSITIYADQDRHIIHIPWILEGSPTSRTTYDVQLLCDEWIRILNDTESGRLWKEELVGVREYYFHIKFIRDPSIARTTMNMTESSVEATDSHQPTQRRRRNNLGIDPTNILPSGTVRNRKSTRGMTVGAPYAGTMKEKHFLRGSLVNRFTKSPALYETPLRPTHTCLMMSLIRCQLYRYEFLNGKCTSIRATNTSSSGLLLDNMYVESLMDHSNSPSYPFISRIGDEWFIKLFQSIKYQREDQSYLPGAKDADEIKYWEMAAEEIWIHLERFKGRNLDYTQLNDYGQAFADFFGVCISIYDVEMRGNRVHVISPYQLSPKALISQKNEIFMVHIVYDQGHIHAVSNLAAFVKSEGRKEELRLHNYCPICDKKQCQELRSSKTSAMDHISRCGNENDFHIGFYDEEKTQSETQYKEVRLSFRKNPRNHKNECFHQCCTCNEEVIQSSYISHVCHIPKKKVANLDERNLFVYDLECAQVIDEYGLLKHECNCLYMRRVYPTTEEEKNGRYFPTEVEFVNALLTESEFVNGTFIAHNGGSYDVHFLLRIFERSEVDHTYVPSPTSPHKFIQIHLTERNIRFIDFMRFIPGSLKNIAEAFEIPTLKGDFPHKFNNGLNNSYIGRMPPLYTVEDYWGLNHSRTEKGKLHFEEWYEQQSLVYCVCDGVCECTKMKWNFQTEIQKYCLQDVIVLAEIVRHYRNECMNFETDDSQGSYPDSRIVWKAPKLDPLQFMTLPQITMQTLIHGFTDDYPEEYKFDGITTFHLNRRGGRSNKAIIWIQRQMSLRQEHIIYRGNALKEYYDFNSGSCIDGWAPISNTAFIFLKCSYWGCPTCMFEHHEFNWIIPERGIYASEVKDAYDVWFHSLQKSFAEIVVIWEHDFNTTFTDPYLIKCSELMKPEECFYGGRTEVFKLYANAEKTRSDIQYHDVTSLYPSVYAHHPLPLGKPKHVLGFDVDMNRFHPTASNRYFGYARIFITPKKSDLLGLLPKRDPESGRLYFPVLPMEGCWGTEEIYLAMQNGYELKEVYELYYWDEGQYSDQHLRGYVGYFLRMKQEAEGWKKLGASSDSPSPEEQEELADRLYYQNGNLGKIRPHLVRKNAVKRSLAKLYLNALWGKFAQKPSKTNHTTIYGSQQFFELWNNKRVEQQSCVFREISPGVYKSSYKLKDEFINPVKHGNLFVAAKVTETARCVLHKQMLRVGPERIIYCDTDSIIFLWDPSFEVLTGVGLGKWTNEYPNHIIKQVYALAPKLYSLCLQPREGNPYEVFRAKGIQMTLENQHKMTFENVKPLIENVILGQENPFSVQVKNFTIFTNSGNSALPYGQLFTRYNEKKVRAIITKRIYEVKESIDWEECPLIETFPIGFTNETNNL